MAFFDIGSKFEFDVGMTTNELDSNYNMNGRTFCIIPERISLI